MHEVLVGTTLLAAFLGGLVALLAPCCISVMLPAYFASGFHRRANLVGMTLVFAAGVGTVIIPIGLGASVISATLAGHHTLVFSAGGVAMALAGAGLLVGWKPRLPMLGMRARSGRGVTSVFTLGAFSGAASACCAPVLAGVAVLSGAAGSFTAALAIGVTYTFGMVAPLCAIAWTWDRRGWGSSRLLAGGTVTLGGRRWTRTVPLGSAAAGVLLVAMGGLSIASAIAGPSMPNRGWRVMFSAELQHVAATAVDGLRWLPGWATGLILVGVLGLLVRHAVRRRNLSPPTDVTPAGRHPAAVTAGAMTPAPLSPPTGEPDACCAERTGTALAELEAHR
ncbi:cytochrome c biogenesis protein CcdA [Frankia sp. Cppng1_Ct_nod]|uniref:cytochrome c biogenesis CcdA family protein n=1 Tax=Frankia sp. Cppng1_Ct_nod TaxID=2897162 RepID=UPI00202500A7|nr:cytochrome c biogenesis protein CcdA [Frankia sp. Cppng1_Ct_nod]